MDYKIFCPKCGESLDILSEAQTYGGGNGFDISCKCNHCYSCMTYTKDFNRDMFLVKGGLSCEAVRDLKETKVELLKDEEDREYINLKMVVGNIKIDIDFYIDCISVKNNDEIESEDKYNLFPILRGYMVNFKVKNKENGIMFNYEEVNKPKQMTKEEIEKELGYKIDIVG